MLGHTNALWHNKFSYFVLGRLNTTCCSISDRRIILDLQFYVVTGTIGIVDYTDYDDMKYSVSSYSIYLNELLWH
jgi:hypothetical protein